MMTQETTEGKRELGELSDLCDTVRELVSAGDYETCRQLIVEAMRQYPHAPQPHNLFGVLLEKQGDHLMAMRHFRAAWALDPTYLPARLNLDRFGTLLSRNRCIFSEKECGKKQSEPLPGKGIGLLAAVRRG